MRRQLNKGFFESLFDFSFNFFITNKIIPLLYVLALIGIGLLALFWTIAAFAYGSQTDNAAIGILTLIIFVPAFVVFATIYARVGLEFLIVIFRIADHVRDIAAGGGFTSSPPLGSGPNSPSAWNQQPPPWQGANPNPPVQPAYPNVAAPPQPPPSPAPSQQPPSSGWRTLG